MTVNANKIVVGGKTFTTSTRVAPQEQVVTAKTEVREEDFTDEQTLSKTTSSFILQSSSKFHRDMIE